MQIRSRCYIISRKFCCSHLTMNGSKTAALFFTITLLPSVFATASVRVFTAPRVDVELSQRFLVKGRPLALACRSDKAELSDVRWFHNGRLLGTDAAGHRVHFADDGGLTLPADWVKAQQGSYWCAANVTVLIDGRPTQARLVSESVSLVAADTEPFDRPLQRTVRVDAVQGEVARVPCPDMPKNIPSPPRMWFEKLPAGANVRHRMWRRRRLLRKRELFPASELGAVLITADSGSRFLLTASALQIGVVQPNDAGRYRCYVANPVTNRTRRARTWVELTVVPSRAAETTPPGPLVLPPGALRYPPVEQPNALVLAAPGNSVLLECLATMGRIRWNRVTPDGRRQPLVDSPKTRQIWGNLNISDITLDDGGQYECEVLPLVASGMTPSPGPNYRAEAGRYTLLVVQPTASVINVQPTSNGLAVECGLEGGLSLGGHLGGQAEIYFDGAIVQHRSDLDRLQTSVEKADLKHNPISVTLAAPPATPGQPGRFATLVQCVVHSAVNLTNLSSLVHMHSDQLQRGHVSSAYVLLETPPLPIVFGKDDFGTSRGQGGVIFSKPYNLSRPLGSTVQLVCMADAGATVHWTNQWGGPVRPNGNKYSIIGTGTLEIRRVGYDDQGWYQCNAQTLDGRVERAPAFLRVTDYDATPAGADAAPPPAFDLFDMAPVPTVTSTPPTPSVARLPVIAAPRVELDGDVVVLEWRLPESIHAAGVRWLQVQMGLHTDSGEEEISWTSLGDDQLPAGTRRTKLVNLKPGHSYQFRVLANLTAPDAIVASEASLPIEVLAPAEPVILRQPPNLLRVTAVSRDALHVQWTYVSEANAQVDGFVVQYRINDGTYDLFSNSSVIGATVGEHIVDHLLPNTEYQVLVRAYNAFGQSLPSNSIFAATDGAGGAIVPANQVPKSNGDQLTEEGESPLLAALSKLYNTPEYFLYAVLAIGLVVVVVMLCCLMCCVMAHRKRARIHKAARGKYVDASRRIHREQSTSLNNNNPTTVPSLYQQTFDTSAQTNTKGVIPMDEMMPMLGAKEGSRAGTLTRGTQYGRCTPLLATPADESSTLGRRAQSNDYDMQIPGRTFYGYHDQPTALATSTPQDRMYEPNGSYAGYILSTTAITNMGHSPMNTLTGGRPRSPIAVPTPTVSVNGALPKSGSACASGAPLGGVQTTVVSAASPHGSNSSSGIGGTGDASLATPTRQNERGQTPSLSTFRPDSSEYGRGSLQRRSTKSPPPPADGRAPTADRCDPLVEDDELPPPPPLLTNAAGADRWRHSSTPSTTCLPPPLTACVDDTPPSQHRQSVEHVHNLSD